MIADSTLPFFLAFLLLVHLPYFAPWLPWFPLLLECELGPSFVLRAREGDGSDVEELVKVILSLQGCPSELRAESIPVEAVALQIVEDSELIIKCQSWNIHNERKIFESGDDPINYHGTPAPALQSRTS